MTANIKYTVRHHARSIKKVAKVLFGFGVIIILLLDLIWIPFKGLTPDLQALALYYFMPGLFWDLHALALVSVALGGLLWPFRWRTGKIELTDEKLIINGSYPVSIWLRNMWEIDLCYTSLTMWRIRLDSNVDAVQIKFKTKEEFQRFGKKLFQLAEQVETIKLKTSSY